MAARLPRPKMNIQTLIQSRAEGSAWGLTYSLDPSAVILVAEFAKLGLDLRSFKEPLHRAVKYMGPSFQANFDVSGRPNKWHELAERTRAIKYYLGASRPSAPLIRFGALRKTVGLQKIWKIDGQEGYAAIDNLGEAWYGIIHQQGVEGELSGELQGPIGRTTGNIRLIETGGIPQREFLLFQKQDEKEIEQIFIRWFQERAVAAGFRPGVSGVVGDL